MKKIFPIIAFLITMSLLGLVLFQFLWLRSAKDFKQQQFRLKVIDAVGTVALRLMDERVPVTFPRRTDLFPNEQRRLDVLNSSVTSRFSREEIQYYLREQFDKDPMLKGVPFEFAIAKSSPFAEPMVSDNFFKYHDDSAHNVMQIAPLQSASGTDKEGLGTEESLVVIVPHERSLILRELIPFFVSALLFTLIITAAFFITTRTLLRQKKLSEIKNDFINNMTHEFKTPIATISLAVDALKNEKVASNPEKSGYFTNVIKEENRRMNKQVETILQAAVLDKNDLQLNLQPLSAHALINTALNNIRLPIEERGGQLTSELKATNDIIMADEVHFTNLINSLLDNAVKYSENAPVVRLTTYNTSQSIRIQIADQGIGMGKDTLNKIFEKFYRAHTGNVHNVKGFGLGLSYVKTMVTAHKGTIKADSALGKGSTFTLTIPLAK